MFGRKRGDKEGESKEEMQQERSILEKRQGKQLVTGGRTTELDNCHSSQNKITRMTRCDSGKEKRWKPKYMYPK